MIYCTQLDKRRDAASMRTQIGSMNNVKIFVLYLMRNINYPLNFTEINDIIMQTDYVMFLDFAVAFHQIEDAGLVEIVGTDEHGEPLYFVSEKGKLIAEQLKSDILSSILDTSLASALRYLDFKRRKVTVHSEEEKLPDGTYNVTVTVREANKVMMCTTVNVDSEYRVHQMRENFHGKPEVIYRGLIALLAGKMDFLFDK